MSDDLVKLVRNSFERNEEVLKNQFLNSEKEVGVRYCFLDDFLPENIAQRVYKAFPGPDQMRLMKSLKEVKYTSKNFDAFDPLLKGVTFAIQHPDVIKVVERITGIQRQQGDDTLYAGGLSLMAQGNYLNPHIDNSHNMQRDQYRTLNLLYYTTPDWDLSCGGNLELWDRSVTRNATIVSKFNRMVLMETNPWSWHSVSPVVSENFRTCVSNYYFSPESPIKKPYFNVTSFQGRPGQYIRRAWLPMENRLRMLLRVLRPGGFGRKDVYEPGNNS